MYTESPRKRLQQKHDPTTKKTTRTRGFDRRAHLLVYASEAETQGALVLWSGSDGTLGPSQRNGNGQVHQQGFGDHFLECFSKEKGNGGTSEL
ncbi:hypothetical protein NC651_005707 [Populus alba x Populus x berolinensis]|nr:hypothetical protein NC651_005707 [Populus alba x Populus x berolinensis]